jgi:hypothetical protein
VAVGMRHESVGEPERHEMSEGGFGVADDGEARTS